MSPWSTRMAAMTLAVSASFSVAGCAADRTAEAAALRPELQALPGVTNSDVDYINDFENGANLDIGLNMSTATLDQIRSAMTRIDDAQQSDFDDHRQSTSIGVSDRGGLEYGGYGKGLDADQVVADAVAVRELNDRVSAAAIRWQRFEDFSSLQLTDSVDADSDLRAVVSALPSTSTLVSVVSRSHDPVTAWDVELPLTLGQVSSTIGIRDHLPVTVYEVEMRDGHVSRLDVNLGDPAEADAKVRAVLTAVAPTPAHPVAIVWRLADDALYENGRFTACSPVDDASPAAPPTPDFAAVHARFAQEFPGCAT